MFCSTSLQLQAYDRHEIRCQKPTICRERQVLYTGGRGFDCRLFELQPLDKDCEREFAMLRQETAHAARTTFLRQITSAVY